MIATWIGIVYLLVGLVVWGVQARRLRVPFFLALLFTPMAALAWLPLLCLYLVAYDDPMESDE